MKWFVFFATILLSLYSCKDGPKGSLEETKISAVNTSLPSTIEATSIHGLVLKLVRPYKNEIELNAEVFTQSKHTEKDGLLSELLELHSKDELTKYKTNILGKIVMYHPLEKENDLEGIVSMISRNGGIACLVYPYETFENMNKEIHSNTFKIPFVLLSKESGELLSNYNKEETIQVFISLMK